MLVHKQGAASRGLRITELEALDDGNLDAVLINIARIGHLLGERV